LSCNFFEAHVHFNGIRNIYVSSIALDFGLCTPGCGSKIMDKAIGLSAEAITGDKVKVITLGE
jgi:hypothetical protein